MFRCQQHFSVVEVNHQEIDWIHSLDLDHLVMESMKNGRYEEDKEGKRGRDGERRDVMEKEYSGG